MRIRICLLATVLILSGNMLYAANGDLLVKGKVGIGTTSPRAILDVGAYASGGTPTSILSRQSEGDPYGYGSYLGVLAWDTTVVYGKMFSIEHSFYGDTNSSINFFRGGSRTGGFITFNVNNNSEAIRINSFGNVGIGTANPSYKLDVAGMIASNGSPITSDIRFKKNIDPIADALTKILKAEGVSYEWKSEEFPDKGFDKGKHYGVIAQEMERAIPEVVSTLQDGSKNVAYTEIIPVLIEAIKEQQKQIEQLINEVKDLRSGDRYGWVIDR